MMRSFILFAVGLVFGMGLYVSGMTQPSKVQGFLDIFGRLGPLARLCHGRRDCGWVHGLLCREAAQPDFSRRRIAVAADRQGR